MPGLYRSANLSFLTGRGRADLQALGLGRLLDLRDRRERQVDAPPFLGRAEYLNLPLLPWRVRAMNEATAAARSNADLYRAHLDHAANQIVTVLGAILDAPAGPVLLHCHAGKDRTGLVTALCAGVAGLARQDIARDYAASGPERSASTPICGHARRRSSGAGWSRSWRSERKTSWRHWTLWTTNGAAWGLIWPRMD